VTKEDWKIYQKFATDVSLDSEPWISAFSASQPPSRSKLKADVTTPSKVVAMTEKR